MSVSGVFLLLFFVVLIGQAVDDHLLGNRDAHSLVQQPDRWVALVLVPAVIVLAISAALGLMASWTR